MASLKTYPKNHVFICRGCGKETKGTFHQKDCLECRKKRKHIERQYKDLPSCTVGALQELKVSIDLLEKGYEVFRALSPSSCDLLIQKNGKQFDIEVRTGYRIPLTGRIVFSKPYKVKAKYKAIVLPNEIIYDPPIPNN